jgi:hypothetical protein
VQSGSAATKFTPSSCWPHPLSEDNEQIRDHSSGQSLNDHMVASRIFRNNKSPRTNTFVKYLGHLEFSLYSKQVLRTRLLDDMPLPSARIAPVYTRVY